MKMKLFNGRIVMEKNDASDTTPFCLGICSMFSQVMDEDSTEKLENSKLVLDKKINNSSKICVYDIHRKPWR